MQKSFKEWLAEGEQIYAEALREYQSLQLQMEELEKRLTAKKIELDDIARVTGKPPVDGVKKLSAQLVEEQPPVIGSGPVPAGTMARALSGRGILSRG